MCRRISREGRVGIGREIGNKDICCLLYSSSVFLERELLC